MVQYAETVAQPQEQLPTKPGFEYLHNPALSRDLDLSSLRSLAITDCTRVYISIVSERSQRIPYSAP